MRENYSSSEGFVLLEALFCLFLASFALGLFGFYLSLPKSFSVSQKVFYPFEVMDQRVITLSASGLIFDVKYKRLKGENGLYSSFEVLP